MRIFQLADEIKRSLSVYQSYVDPNMRGEMTRNSSLFVKCGSNMRNVIKHILSVCLGSKSEGWNETKIVRLSVLRRIQYEELTVTQFVCLSYLDLNMSEMKRNLSVLNTLNGETEGSSSVCLSYVDSNMRG